MPYPRAVPLLVLLAACVDPGDEAPPDTEAVPFVCHQPACGNGSYLADGLSWELDETMTSYSQMGVRIVSMTSGGGVAVKPHIVGFNLWGRVGNVLHPPLGSKLLLENKDGVRYQLTIGPPNAGVLPYQEAGNDGTLLPIYGLTYRKVLGNGKLGPIIDACLPDPLSSIARDAIFFQGDRYDLLSGRVMAIGDDALPWFNIGCRDDALWKLAVFRFVQAAQAPGFMTSQLEREVALRSIRADYCYNNEAHTVSGIGVDWVNRGGWLTRDSMAFPEIEAVWTTGGIHCVSKERYEQLPTTGCPSIGYPPQCSDPPVLPSNWSMITYVQ
jgi:hypothetical protein